MLIIVRGKIPWGAVERGHPSPYWIDYKGRPHLRVAFFARPLVPGSSSLSLLWFAAQHWKWPMYVFVNESHEGIQYEHQIVKDDGNGIIIYFWAFKKLPITNFGIESPNIFDLWKTIRGGWDCDSLKPSSWGFNFCWCKEWLLRFYFILVFLFLVFSK